MHEQGWDATSGPRHGWQLLRRVCCGVSRGRCCDLFVAALLYNNSSAAVVTRVLELGCVGLLRGPFLQQG